MSEQIDLSQRLYSTLEVAKMFGVTEYTVRDWIKEKKFRATKLGKRWRIPESELVKFANEKYGE